MARSRVARRAPRSHCAGGRHGLARIAGRAAVSHRSLVSGLARVEGARRPRDPGRLEAADARAPARADDRPERPADVRGRRQRAEARSAGHHRRLHARVARREPARTPAGRLLRAGDVQRLHHGHPRRRPHHQGPPRPGRGPELPHVARQSRHQRREGAHRSEGGRGREDRVRPEEPAHRTSARHEVRQAHQVQERHPQRLVGHGHLPRRRRPAARGLGRTPDGALPDHLQPRALPAHVRRDPRNAPGPVGARSRSSASRPPPTASTRTGSRARWAASSSCSSSTRRPSTTIRTR